MEITLTDGKYTAANSGGLAVVSGIDEIVQRVVMKLTARRGQAPVFLNYGSRLHTLHKIKPSERLVAAKQFVSEALADEPALSIETIELSPLADDGILITIQLNYQDRLLTVSARI